MMLRGVLVVLVVLLLFAAGGVAFLGYLVTRPSPLVMSRPTVLASSEGVRHFDQKIRQLEQQIADAQESGQKKSVSVVLTDEDLTSELARLLADQQVGEPSIRDIQIHLTPSGPVATASVSVRGLEVSVAAQLAVDVSEGRPLVNVQRVDIGALPLPGPIVDQVRDAINRSLDLSGSDLPITLTSMQFAEGQVRVEAQTK